jgi:intracellular multiplication protein IcmD
MLRIFLLCSLLCVAATVNAAEMAATTFSLGNMAKMITNTFAQIAKLITAGSYIAGLAFSIGAIMKFKQHKDNPTQIQIGTPVSLAFIAAALLFLPSILSMISATMFGSEAQVGGTTGYLPGIDTSS